MEWTISPKAMKHVPQRTCVACSEVKAKGEMVRLMRNPDRTIGIDTGGKKAGRGAYLCRQEECWQTAAKGGRLEHKLGASLTPEQREELRQFGKTFSE